MANKPTRQTRASRWFELLLGDPGFPKGFAEEALSAVRLLASAVLDGHRWPIWKLSHPFQFAAHGLNALAPRQQQPIAALFQSGNGVLAPSQCHGPRLGPFLTLPGGAVMTSWSFLARVELLGSAQ